MIVLIGYGVALGCIFGAFILHGGNIGVILHALPTELMAILGGSLSAFAVNNQPKVLKATLSAIPACSRAQVFEGALHGADGAALRHPAEGAEGRLMAIEKDVEDPRRSSRNTRSSAPTCGRVHHRLPALMVSGNLNSREIESLMDSEIETHHHEAHGPSRPGPPGRCAAGLRHRRGGAGRRQHHGLGRTAASDPRRHDRLGAGRHLPRHPARLA
jgi:chemotaxis protein MotA